MTNTFPHGNRLLQRAHASIPAGIVGFHKLMASPEYPSFLERGHGARVVDVDGNEYIDHVLGKGPVILGHAHPGVTQAVIEQAERGSMLGLTQAVQIDVAELLLAAFPGAEKIRFHKTGSDACSAAVRLARTFTARRWILSSGYHGWHDWCNTADAGVPASTVCCADFAYDLDRLEMLLDEHHGDIAALFVEPQPSFLEPGFYAELRALADAAGCLLMFDEVKTGLRLPRGSAQAAAGVTPDLTTVSKAIANGYCLSAVLGRAEFMDVSERTHISTTYDIEAIPFAAARATLHELLNTDALKRIDAMGCSAVNSLNALCALHDVGARAFGPGAMFRIGFADADAETMFYVEMVRRGVLMYPYDNHFISLAHGADELQQTIAAADNAFGLVARAFPNAPPHGAVAAWEIDRFQNRKGYLRSSAGPDGRRSRRARTAQAIETERLRG
ncbi:MAG TPA: aminotransferase class III-fold pyridoxal phosphate-dependent enzyme [Candidatus Kapabacteria bacterium]|nr:aminotransferase class III-fold pyridoxal phosphate-dependent enzyme [Candidatus Kapabacteria bacterium]